MLRVYLKDAITDFQHKFKLIGVISPILELNIARVNGDLPFTDLQNRIQSTASRFASGPQTLSTLTPGF